MNYVGDLHIGGNMILKWMLSHVVRKCAFITTEYLHVKKKKKHDMGKAVCLFVC